MAITKISPSVVDFDAGITITVDDNSDTLTLTSTDADNNSAPYLRMYRNSASPADADPLTRIKFDGRNDNSQDVTYGYIQVFSTDVSDGTEDGTIDHYSIVGGTARNRISLSPTETVLNEDSRDLDFRVESDGNANALVINGGNNNVGIGADPLASYAGYTTLYVGGNTNFMSNTAAEGSSSVNYSHNAQFDTDGSWEYIATDEASNYYQSGGGHYFRVAASGSAGADITWVNGPNIDVNGNLIFPSGKGIDFSATSDGTTMSSELLNDYEQGAFTGTITTSGTDFTTTGRTGVGHYTKIGNVVNIMIEVTISTPTSGTSYVKVTGLPFDPIQMCVGSLSTGRVDPGASAWLPVVGAATTEITFRCADASGGNQITQMEAGSLNANPTPWMNIQITMIV